MRPPAVMLALWRPGSLAVAGVRFLAVAGVDLVAELAAGDIAAGGEAEENEKEKHFGLFCFVFFFSIDLSFKYI